MSKLELVEHHHDVRRLFGRLAGFFHHPLEMADFAGVGIEEATGEIVLRRGHAGAHEFGEIFAVVELAVGIGRPDECEAGEQRQRGDGAQRRDRAAHAQRIEPPDETKQGEEHSERKRDLLPEARIYREQERDGVGIDDHEVDEVDRHEHHAVLELRAQDQHRDERERKRARKHGTAQQREPEAIQNRPAEQERDLRDDVVLVAEHDRERGKMQDDDDAERDPLTRRARPRSR